jgi:hypothetical protein
VDEWDVEIEFAKSKNRTDTPSINQTLGGQSFPAAFAWTFTRSPANWQVTTRYGSLVTDRVDAEFLGTGENGVRRFELTTRLTQQQAYAFEMALSQLGGVRVREIPDAPNEAVDDTNGTATLTIDSPVSDATVQNGEYVVLEWESERLNDAYQQVELTIAES